MQVTRTAQGYHWCSKKENHYHNKLKTMRILLIILANFCYVKILNFQLHDSHTQHPIAAPMLYPTTHVSMIIPNSVNSQQSPSCMNMHDVIINGTNDHKETQNRTKKLQIIINASPSKVTEKH
jgi:hypothetical protein